MITTQKEVPRVEIQDLEYFSQKRREEKNLLKKIKRRIGEDYPTFKRNHDVYFEVFRIQCLLISPFLTKNMFNHLTKKLLKLEEERLSINDVKKPFEKTYLNIEYFKFYLDKMDQIRDMHDAGICSACGSIFHIGQYGLSFCVNCTKNCKNCGSHYWFCECGDYEQCCDSLEFCECEECLGCKNSCDC